MVWDRKLQGYVCHTCFGIARDVSNELFWKTVDIEGSGDLLDTGFDEIQAYELGLPKVLALEDLE